MYLVLLVLPHFIFVLCFGPNIAQHHHKTQVFIALSGSKKRWSVQINGTAWARWAPQSKLGFGICHSSTELPWGKAVAAFVTLLASLVVPGLEKSAPCKAGLWNQEAVTCLVFLPMFPGNSIRAESPNWIVCWGKQDVSFGDMSPGCGLQFSLAWGLLWVDSTPLSLGWNPVSLFMLYFPVSWQQSLQMYTVIHGGVPSLRNK